MVLWPISPLKGIDVKTELAEPTDQRIYAIAEAFKMDMSVEEIHDLSKIDHWFLEKLKNIHDLEVELRKYAHLEDLPSDLLRNAKRAGYSDFQIARCVFKSTSEVIGNDLLKVRAERKKTKYFYR